MTTPTTETATALLGTHCATCDRTFYPARDLCPTCWADDLPAASLPTTGTIATWTVVRTGKRFPTPYALAYADFDGDVRVLGRVANWEEGRPLRPGATVTTHATVEDTDGRPRTVDHSFTVDLDALED